MTDKTDVHPAYLAVGANRQTAAADWGADGTLCFGAGVNLALWRPCDATPKGVVSLLGGHKDTVKAVQCLPLLEDHLADGTRTSYVVSGGDDRSLKLWAIVTSSSSSSSSSSDARVSATCLQTVDDAHTAPINCIASAAAQAAEAAAGDRADARPICTGDSSRVLVASGAADATIKIWGLERQPEDMVDGSSSHSQPVQMVLRQTIPTKPRYFPLCLALVALPRGPASAAWVLAAAGTSTRIQMFVGTTATTTTTTTNTDFSLQASLGGHEGWIRSLDFGWEEGAGRGDLLLASASQDKYIRLWRIHKSRAGAKDKQHKDGHQDDHKDNPQPHQQQAPSPARPALGGLLPPPPPGGQSPSNKAHTLQVACDGADDAGDADNTDAYAVTFEALLLGHDDWIYSARWAYDDASSPSAPEGGPPRLRLLSASADNSLGIWEADRASGIWVTTARLGELSKEKGATSATGSVGGFWTGLWGPPPPLPAPSSPSSPTEPATTSVVTLCRTGSWRRWDYDPAQDRWVPAVAVSGHVAAVTGVAWSRSGAYLLSTSGDQTTRLHAEWTASSPEEEEEEEEEEKAVSASVASTRPSLPTWHEMSRPQIHGYDLNCIDSLGPAQFVSGADEKLMRVFHEPKTVARLLRRLGGRGRRRRRRTTTTTTTTTTTAGQEGEPDADDEEEAAVAALPDAAHMPVLGLSNKAVVVDEDQEGEGGDDAREPLATAAADHHLRHQPPTEDVLARSTLWPEAEKLYGHGFEISCLAVSPSGRLVASACRATSLNHAVVRLFETEHWTEVRPPLALHTLTVTRLRFSGSGSGSGGGSSSSSPPAEQLLSVGRDRQWGVWWQPTTRPAHEEAGGRAVVAYTLRQAQAKAHTRMMLDGAWAPPAPNRGDVFATAGRDKNVKVWAASASGGGGGGGGEGSDFALVATIPQTHPVTAVDFLPGRRTASSSSSSFLVLAVGTEAGQISVLSLATDKFDVSTTFVLDSRLSLPKAVLQLAWRPEQHETQDKTDKTDKTDDLAIAGEDGSLRVYRFNGL